MVTGFIFLEECARYLYLLKVNIINIHDGGMNGAEAVHLSFLNGGLVFVQFHSLHGHILCAGAVSDTRKGLSAANLVTKINFLIAALNIFYLMKPLSTHNLWF